MPKTKGVNREDWVRQIDALRETGMSAVKACEQVGYHYATYYAAKREMGQGRDHRVSLALVQRLQEENSLLWGLVKQMKRESA